MTACDFQQALFRMLRERAAHPRSLVNELSGVIYKSRPTIYKKMQGNIMLTVDELIAICSHYGIDVDPLLNESPSYSSLVLDSKGADRNPMQLLIDQLHKWANQPDTQVLIDQPGPFVHAFLKPEIVSFILFFERARSNPDLTFDLHLARRDREIISYASKVNRAYRSLHRIELWRPNMYDVLLNRIVQCARVRRFARQNDAIELCAALCDTLPMLEERFRSRLDRNNNKSKLYIADRGLSTDAICVRTGERYSLYRGRWYGEWTLTYSEPISRRSYRSMRRTIFDHHQRITASNELPVNSFFGALKQKIQQTRRNIEAHDLSAA